MTIGQIFFPEQFQPMHIATKDLFRATIMPETFVAALYSPSNEKYNNNENVLQEVMEYKFIENPNIVVKSYFSLHKDKINFTIEKEGILFFNNSLEVVIPEARNYYFNYCKSLAIALFNIKPSIIGPKAATKIIGGLN